MGDSAGFSRIGLGTFPFSGAFGSVDAAVADQVIHRFIEVGGRYIQTAPYYEGVDHVVGASLKRLRRESYSIGTLCVKDRRGERRGSFDAVVAQCEDSLRTLGVDVIDLLMTSTPKATDATFEETMAALEFLRDTGKIRGIGVSNVDLRQLKEYNATHAVRYVQNRFSFINRAGYREIADYCVQNEIELIPYQVIERGILSSRGLHPFSFRAGDLRLQKPEFRTERLALFSEWLGRSLQPLAAQRGITIESLAVWWALHQPAVGCVLVGATSPSQIETLFSAVAMPSDDGLLSQMELSYGQLREEVERSGHRDVSDLFM
jgi:aryl-alcohol dehydrogenase-like predicted oxidoreductase